MVSACCPGDGDEDLTYSRQKPTALLVGGGRRRRQSAALSLCNGGCFPATGWWYILGSAQSLVNGPDDGAEGAVAHVALYWVGMICWFPEKRVRCLWRYGLQPPGAVIPIASTCAALVLRVWDSYSIWSSSKSCTAKRTSGKGSCRAASIQAIMVGCGSSWSNDICIANRAHASRRSGISLGSSRWRS